jgi:hypothetical protein
MQQIKIQETLSIRGTADRTLRLAAPATDDLVPLEDGILNANGKQRPQLSTTERAFVSKPKVEDSPQSALDAATIFMRHQQLQHGFDGLFHVPLHASAWF